MTRSRQQLHLNAGRFQESFCFKLVTNTSDLTSRYESDLAGGDSVISHERCLTVAYIGDALSLGRRARRSFSRRSIKVRETGSTSMRMWVTAGGTKRRGVSERPVVHCTTRWEAAGVSVTSR